MPVSVGAAVGPGVEYYLLKGTMCWILPGPTSANELANRILISPTGPCRAGWSGNPFF